MRKVDPVPVVARATETLAGFLLETRLEDVPATAIHQTRRLILDTLGCAVGGFYTATGRLAVDLVEELGGHPQATVLGDGRRTSMALAAYANAQMANALDFDETLVELGGHFAQATLMAALAVAEHEGRSGRDLLKAMLVGYEVGARVGISLGGAVEVKGGQVQGWNKAAGKSAACVWGAVAAAARLLRLDRAQTLHAFGIAGPNCPIPIGQKWGEDLALPLYKYNDHGWCAQVGLTAALRARRGDTGVPNVLDGPLGFWRAYGAERERPEVLVGDLGRRWFVEETSYKPWPACRWIHYPLALFLDLLKEHDLRPDEIEEVVVGSNPLAMSPRFANQEPTTLPAYEFSYAHAFAAAALGLRPGAAWFAPDALADRRLQALRRKVQVELDPRWQRVEEWHAGEPIMRRIPSRVAIRARGRLFEAEGFHAKGDPWTPETRLSDQELEQKFRDACLSTHADCRACARQVEEAIGLVWQIERSASLAPLVARLYHQEAGGRRQ